MCSQASEQKYRARCQGSSLISTLDQRPKTFILSGGEKRYRDGVNGAVRAEGGSTAAQLTGETPEGIGETSGRQ
jgi:hypothetical protein